MIIPFDKSKYDYSTEEILENITGSRLLSAEIEFNRSCNYLCPYCYAAGNSDHAQLDPAVATDAIRQVHALGAKKIVVLGGEPLLCKQLKANIELITGELGMGAEIFTNGALINEDWAKFFFEHGCRVVVKLNSLRPEVQERLTGVPNALDKAFHAIRVLKDAGFDSEMLVASSVISAENEQEVAELWKYLRRNAIKPYLEIMTPQGRLLENRDLEVHPRRLKEIFDEIAAFDNANGYDWEPQPPLVGSKCLRHLYSCVIGATGNVTPCVGLTEVLGNIYERKLSDILGTSVVLRKLKDFRNTIKGPCKTCEKADSCYGCRGAVYQLTGDYLASDPLCWKNCDTLLDQPYPLPCDAQQWLPHRPPMTMVESSIQRTLSMWDSVRNGEKRWIFPYQENADVIFNSSTLYELAVLKKHIYPLLTAIGPEEECYEQVRGMVKVLNYVIEADVDDEIPPTSLVREFVGGNTFYRK